MDFKYAILKEGFNADGTYSLFLEQEFESKESGRVWNTPIMMIYSTKADNYDDMSEEYKLETSREAHDQANLTRINDHAEKIGILVNGNEKDRESIIVELLNEHRAALKLSEHIDENLVAKHKTLTEEEIKAELEARPKSIETVKEYKTISQG